MMLEKSSTKNQTFVEIDCNKKVIEAINLMESSNIEYAIVSENKNLVGVLTYRDYFEKIVLAEKNADDIIVKEIMTEYNYLLDKI